MVSAARNLLGWHLAFKALLRQHHIVFVAQSKLALTIRSKAQHSIHTHLIYRSGNLEQRYGQFATLRCVWVLGKRASLGGRVLSSLHCGRLIGLCTGLWCSHLGCRYSSPKRNPNKLFGPVNLLRERKKEKAFGVLKIVIAGV